MGRRIETVTRIWRTIRTLEIRSNFFGVRVGSKQKITTKVLMVTVFLRQNAKYFRISFWKPLERTALEFKDNKTTNIPHKYEGSNLIWGKTSNTVHTKYKSFYHSVYCLNVTLVSHKRKSSFSNHVKRIHPNFKILLSYCQYSNSDWFFYALTWQEKETFKQGTILESSVVSEGQ